MTEVSQNQGNHLCFMRTWFVFWRFSPELFSETNSDVSVFLLPDAKIPKNISEDFVGGDFADDGAEGVDGFADVLSGEVGRETGGEAFADAEEGSAGIGESLNVALVCDQGCVAVCKKIALSSC